MSERDIFKDFTINKVFDKMLEKVIFESLTTTGLFGYAEYRSLERTYMGNFTDGYFIQGDPEELSNVTLLRQYLTFINGKMELRDLVRVLSIINKRSELIDLGLTVGSWHAVTSWDLASNDVANAGKEARLLILHKVLTSSPDEYMFNMISDEYLRAVIDKYDRVAYSLDAVDIITTIPTCPEDRQFVYMLLFAVYAFTCIKTYGHATTNTAMIAETALQLCGTGIIPLDYYFKKIYTSFKDVDLIVNYNLLTSIYGSETEYGSRIRDSILAPTITGQFKHGFSSIVKRYLTLTSSRYEVDDIYFKIIGSWKDTGIWAKSDIRKDVSYINQLNSAQFRDSGLKTLIDAEEIIIPHVLFSVLKSILEVSPELDSNVSLYDLPIFDRSTYSLWDEETIAGKLRTMFRQELFTDLPAWKHCLLILLYLKVDCKLPIIVTKENLTNDLIEQINFYCDLYKDVGAGKDYKYMLSP